MSAKTAAAVVVAAMVGLVAGAFWASNEASPANRADRKAEVGGLDDALDELDVRQIRALLTEQDEAWNAGDLEGFMKGYWNDKELTFYSEAKVEKGYKELQERYRKKYQAGEKKDMGKLTFGELEIQGPRWSGWATARGRWKLEKDGKAVGGLFTLVLRRIGGEWKIVHDHTSEGLSADTVLADFAKLTEQDKETVRMGLARPKDK